MLDIRVTDLIVAYLSAAVAPALVVFVTERSALNDLKAKCDTLWYNIKIILIKECNYPRGDYVFEVLSNSTNCDHVASSYRNLKLAYFASFFYSIYTFILSIDALAQNNLTGALFWFALTVGVIYIIMIVAGTPSGELKRRVSLFESSINTLTASCKRSSKEHN